MSPDVIFPVIFVILFFWTIGCVLSHRQRQRIAVRHVMQNRRRVVRPQSTAVTDGIAVAIIVPDESVRTPVIRGVVV